MRCIDTLFTLFVVHSDLSVSELIGCTSVNFSIECFMGVRWSELARSDLPTVRSCNDLLVDGAAATMMDALLEQLLDHQSELLVVLHELVELVLTQVASSTCRAEPCASQVGHLLLELTLDFTETGVLQHV